MFSEKGTIKKLSWLKQDQYKVSRGVYSLLLTAISPQIEDIISKLFEETAFAVDTVNRSSFVISSLTIILYSESVFVLWGYLKILNLLFLVNNFILSLLRSFNNGKTMNVS